jgi:hypothetical protein
MQVPAAPVGFSNPPEERARLEQLLAERGLDLALQPA